MLRFRSFIREQHLILENRIEKLKTIFKDKIDSSHDTHAVHKTSDDIIDHFSRHADPSRTKEHTQWIINKYRSGNFRQEDHARIHKALSDFETHKSKLPNKDLNSYKRLSDVEDAIEPHMGTVSRKEEKRQIKSEGADLIHSGNGVTIHHLKTEDAAKAYGAGTKWCTAAEKNCKFNDYNKTGPIHIIQHAGKKYQFHNNSQQFMDEKDNSTDISKIHPDIQKEMLKSDHPEIHKASLIFKHPDVTPEHISTALRDKNPDIRWQAIKHPKATPEHISTALRDENSDVRQTAIRHPKATPEHISTALKDVDVDVRQTAIRHPNTTPEHISTALRDKNSDVRWSAIKHPNVTPEHISTALRDENSNVRWSAIKHPLHKGQA